MKTLVAVILVLAAAPSALAQQAQDYTDLPRRAQVTAALASHPDVIAARLGVREQTAAGERLKAGPYEYSVRVGAAQRRVDNPADTLAEWDIALERPIRFGRKAGIDEALGLQGIEVARLSASNAWIGTARDLLRAWFAWLRQETQFDIWQRQLDTLRSQPEIIDKRVRAGDAPRMETNLGNAAVALAEAQLAQIAARELAARRELTSAFRNIDPPAQAPQAEPVNIEQPIEYFLDRALQYNDELNTARATTRLRSLAAQRAAADLTPDPIVGIRYSNERGGEEKVAGVYLSIPIGGSARSATRSSADALTDIAAQHESAAQRRIAAEVSLYYTTAQGSYAAWLKAREAAAGMQRNAESVERGHRLGELGLADVLIARRLSIEAEMVAALARLDAAENRYRLMIETHLLWENPDQTAQH